ncbi:leishmanolysin-like peptidase, partial [Tanacetum coccineum]
CSVARRLLFDGFDSRGDVKVILATNKIESLDPALIRPGRIDRKIEFPLPNIKTRRRILQAFLDNFTGLELEDGGGRRMSGSHWEKRHWMNEIMTGLVDTRTVVSKMTLALLEDSGWYEANYSMTARLDWGHNQGTEFVTTPCNL